MKGEILFLEPVFKEMIWGGDRLKTEFGYEIPGDHTGECWAVSAHENGDCTVLSGAFQGKKLSRLWEENKELFGNLEGDKFPLLVKIIDAKDDLSIQVHPDDAYAKEHENGSLGKTECWYILDCDEGNEIVLGHNAKTKGELSYMIDEGKWDALIRTQPIKKGDFLQINPGCIHAIKGGTLILETQQNSDITYRVYDYERLSNGRPRELHVEKSKEVIAVPFKEADFPSDGETLISCDYYTVKKWDVNGKKLLVQDKPFMILSIIEGEGAIDGIELKKGMHFILPFEYGEFVLDGHMTVIASYVAE